jgi:hypothetical protein
LPPTSDPRGAWESETRALARGTYVLRFLREEGLLGENPHLVLRFADTLLKSLRGISLERESV